MQWMTKMVIMITVVVTVIINIIVQVLFVVVAVVAEEAYSPSVSSKMTHLLQYIDSVV